jgi:hypothetical protein
MKLLMRIAWPIWKTVKHINFSWLIAIFLIGNFLVISFSHVSADCSTSTSANGIYQGACSTQSGNVHDISEGLITQMSGPSTSTSSTSGEVPGYQQGAIYQIGNLDDVMYHTPPASAIVWAMDQYQQVAGSQSILVSAQTNFNPANTSTYFPGLGFDLLRPVLGLWTWTRNIAYGFFIIILIVIAFLILFRQQLGGGAAVSVANSLPSIILSLVLVTLSYPLSAAFVDLVYVGSGFLQSVMITSPGSPGEGTSDATLKTLQPDDREMSIWGIWGTANALVCQNNNDCSINTLLPADLQQDNPASGVVGKAIGVFTNAFNAGNGIVGNTLIRLLITLIALGATIKLFLALLNNYLILTTLPIFAPFVFLTAAIPGRSGSVIANYFKMLLAASLVFIVIYGIFLFLVLIGTSDTHGLFNNALTTSAIVKWGPPLLGYSTDQIAGGIYKTILIYAVYLFAPSVPDLIKGNLGVPTGNVFFQTIAQRTTANFGFINQVRARAATYLPGSEGGG